MVLPCTKTVKKTMASAVVKKSSLYQLVSSRTAARENPTAPLFCSRSEVTPNKQNISQPESSVGNDDLLLPADPVGAELVHHRREQDGDQEPEILSEDSIFIMVMISKVVIRNLK